MSTIDSPAQTRHHNSSARVCIASLVGTTIEFFDFYIYATAAVLVFPHLFFPVDSDSAATLKSLVVFAVAFIARPIGAALFGHLGDRIGRKSTLVMALLLMGLSTICIGLLPTYTQIGIAAPFLLALCRFGQGLGLGGEWGGAILLATENAPAHKRAWYGMFPQLGIPLGFILATLFFILLGAVMSNQAFLQWGWRIPFVSSALLVLLGLYIRISLHETPAFQKLLHAEKKVNVPLKDVFTKHGKTLFLGTMASICTFVLFYIVSVFALNWGTTALGYARSDFLKIQLLSTLFFATFIPLSAMVAEKYGRKYTYMAICIMTALFAIALPYFFIAGHIITVTIFLCIGLSIMGCTCGPMGTILSEMFPTSVRYTGSGLACTLAAILGASIAPFTATSLAQNFGLSAVSYYLVAASVISFVAFIFIKETKDTDLNHSS